MAANLFSFGEVVEVVERDDSQAEKQTRCTWTLDAAFVCRSPQSNVATNERDDTSHDNSAREHPKVDNSAREHPKVTPTQ